MTTRKLHDAAMWNGIPLAQMTKRQLIGVIEQLQREAKEWERRYDNLQDEYRYESDRS